jgi:hypothetical protein
LGLALIVFFSLFWHPSYTNPGRFGWRGAEGLEEAARAVSGEETEAEVEELLELIRGSDKF